MYKLIKSIRKISTYKAHTICVFVEHLNLWLTCTNNTNKNLYPTKIDESIVIWCMMWVKKNINLSNNSKLKKNEKEIQKKRNQRYIDFMRPMLFSGFTFIRNQNQEIDISMVCQNWQKSAGKLLYKIIWRIMRFIIYIKVLNTSKTCTNKFRCFKLCWFSIVTDHRIRELTGVSNTMVVTAFIHLFVEYCILYMSCFYFVDCFLFQ